MRKLVQEQKELQLLESRIREANAGMATSSSSAAISIEKLRKQLTPNSKSFICCVFMNIACMFPGVYEYYDYYLYTISTNKPSNYLLTTFVTTFPPRTTTVATHFPQPYLC